MNNETELPEPYLVLSNRDDCYSKAKECTCLPYRYCYGMGDKRACDVEDVEKWKKLKQENDQPLYLDFDWVHKISDKLNNNPEDYE